jgi:hypothetical protein
VDLRFHDREGTAKLRECFSGLLWTGSDTVFQHRDAVVSKDPLRLELMNLHGNALAQAAATASGRLLQLDLNVAGL